MYENDFGFDERIPENIRILFMHLCQDVASLYIKWMFYLELFSSQENTNLMSELARSSFQIIEECIRIDLTMAICRLSDPFKSSGKLNLSIEALFRRCDKNEELEKLFKCFRKACAPIRQLRNKFVGHNDLKTRIEPKDHPLPGIGRSQINNILGYASTILNRVIQKYADTELGFDMPLQIGGASGLVDCLKIAKEYQNKDKIY